MSMEALGDSLKKRLQKSGATGAFTAAAMLDVAKRVLPKEATPKSIYNGVLWIEVATGADAYFFKQESDTYIERVNAALGKEIIHTLRLRVRHDRT